jgi:hypothetical protein
MGSVFTFAFIGFLNALLLTIFPPQPSLATPQSLVRAVPLLLSLIITSLAIKRVKKLEERKLNLFLFGILTVVTRFFYVLFLWRKNALVIDFDLELFYRYAREFVEGGYPAMEYPQGALLLFSLPTKLGADVFGFRVFLYLLNLVSDLIIIGSLWILGQRFKGQKVAQAASLWWALFPFDLVFSISKYEPVVAACLLLGVVLFTGKKLFLSGALLGLGFTLKWLPVLVAPALIIYLFDQKRFRDLIVFCLGLVIPGVMIMLPFYLRQPLTFKFTYHFHRIRVTNGESIYYPLIALVQSQRRLTSNQAPWADVPHSIFGRTLTTLIQAGLISLVTLLVFRFREKGKARPVLVLSQIAVCLFILFNRVFSPQFFVILAASFLASAILVDLSPGSFLRYSWLLLLASLFNYLVWPFFASQWLIFSSLFFLILLGLVALLFYRLFSAGPLIESG